MPIFFFVSFLFSWFFTFTLPYLRSEIFILNVMSNIETEKLMCVLFLVLGEYVMVLLAVIADLISGVRKARQRGEARRSKAFRLTVDKTARYYNALFALSVIDAMQIAAVEYLRISFDFSLPLIPVFTLIGSIGIAMIEVKSIYEKADVKQQRDYADAVALLSRLLKHTDLSALDGYLHDYLNGHLHDNLNGHLHDSPPANPHSPQKE